jgi:acetolactate synthase-1/2/3 large subunit
VLDGVPRGDGRRARAPSYLEIGRDILDNKVPLESAVIPGEPSSYRGSTKSIGDPNDVDKLTEILINAERPCVLLGSQVWTSRATSRRSSSSAS